VTSSSTAGSVVQAPPEASRRLWQRNHSVTERNHSVTEEPSGSFFWSGRDSVVSNSSNETLRYQDESVVIQPPSEFYTGGSEYASLSYVNNKNVKDLKKFALQTYPSQASLASGMLWFQPVCTKLDCSVENLTCVSKSSGFCISRHIFSVCCESCLNSVRNGTCFDTCFKKIFKPLMLIYLFLLSTKCICL
jgi:hypothetical protein